MPKMYRLNLKSLGMTSCLPCL